MKTDAASFTSVIACPYKFYLETIGARGKNQAIENELRQEYLAYRTAAVGYYSQQHPPSVSASSPRTKSDPTVCVPLSGLSALGYDLYMLLVAFEDVKKPSGTRKEYAYISLGFSPEPKVLHEEKMSLAFAALVLSEAGYKTASYGRIIAGMSFSTKKIALAKLKRKARTEIKLITTIQETGEKSPLRLDRYCSLCCFSSKCRKKATEKKALCRRQRVNKIVQYSRRLRCPYCRSRRIKKNRLVSKVTYGLLFMSSGVKKWVVKHIGESAVCRDCDKYFRPRNWPEERYKYRHGIMAWVIYQNIELGITHQGILVSDYYSAYDSFPCLQQRCLIHLVRDLNDDLLMNPFDAEFKTMVVEFGCVLKWIVETIDRFGLKSRFLRKHRKEVTKYFRKFVECACQSDLAKKYQDRLLKNKNRLFTFLEYDGIPWNNNNAENAIKAFAKMRRTSDTGVTVEGLNRTLLLLSIAQTLKYKNMSFLDFLKSGERSLETYLKRLT